MDHFSAINFCFCFSGIIPSVGLSSFSIKMLEKVMKITHFDVLGGPFVDLEQACRRVPTIMQNYAKVHTKSRKMSTKEYGIRFCNGQKCTPSLHLRKCIKTRSFLSFPILFCSRHECKIVQNRRRLIKK